MGFLQSFGDEYFESVIRVLECLDDKVFVDFVRVFWDFSTIVISGD